jgi:hypothetical protein
VFFGRRELTLGKQIRWCGGRKVLRMRWWGRGGTPSLRTRLLASVLIPSALVLATGAVVSYNQVVSALTAQTIAEASRVSATGGTSFFPNLISERGASMLYLAAPTPQNKAALDQARAAVDGSFTELREATDRISALLPASASNASSLGSQVDGVVALRSQVDSRNLARGDVFAAYSKVVDVLSYGSDLQGARAQSAASGNSINRSGDLHRIADMIERANSVLVSGLVSGDLSPGEFDQYITYTGGYKAAIETLLPKLTPIEQERVAAVQAGTDWQQVSALAYAVTTRGFAGITAELSVRSSPLPDLLAAETSARNLARQFMEIGFDRRGALAAADEATARGAVTSTIIIAVVALIALVVAFLIALLVTAKLVRRLTMLRRETLDLAETALPLAVGRLRRGERLDLDTEIPTLDHGRDEIGQVAAAFNKAQRTAVEAAVEEAHTREGFNAAFLNIARRSQAILHQQMQVLDRIERTEVDPDRLDLLFSLDHLATRERRNAENLIILGGEQPRRQWRNPVPLGELVRAAVSESEQYQRVTIGTLPHVLVAGAAVGDLVHLIAELVDNATAFSPPESPIEVHGTVVGRGVVIEVEDQGLGIEEDQMVQLNELLRNPPDFGLFTLSRDSRIGLFVVARLARRHAVTVTLRSSAFGGVRAGLMVPTAVLAGDTSSLEPARQPVGSLTGRAAHRADRPENGHLDNGHHDNNQYDNNQYDNGRHDNGQYENNQYENANGHYDNGNGRPDHRAAPAPEQTSSVRVPAWVDFGDSQVLEPPSFRLRGLEPEREPDRREPPDTPRGHGERPRLPRRTRLAHMDSRLLDRQEQDGPPPNTDTDMFGGNENYTPETARSRMSALRRGTAQARMHDAGSNHWTEGRPT